MLAQLDREITCQMDRLNQVKQKNQKTQAKLPTEGDDDNMLELVNMVAEMEILRAKKDNASKVCTNKYEILV